jgi:hypothetical protein
VNPALYTQISEAAAGRYSLVLETFRSLVFTAHLQPFTAERSRGLREDALRVAQSFLVSERPYVEEGVLQAAQDALRQVRHDLGQDPSTDVPDALQPYVEQAVHFILTELAAQLTRDAEALVKRHREFAIAADLAAKTRSVNLRSVFSDNLTPGQKLRFRFQDRAGRSYPSQKFVRSVWRHTLIGLAADFYMLEASALGAAGIAIVHPDSNSQWNGYQLDLTNPAEYISIREEAFHPQSQMTLKAS